ncbi:hypothetical protein BDR06DRAFT_1008915 [Suillus hirtellus]|nr:hypothetical protein BDR06DRAFT_1008915 [Suillus hirtellus]
MASEAILADDCRALVSGAFYFVLCLVSPHNEDGQLRVGSGLRTEGVMLPEMTALEGLRSEWHPPTGSPDARPSYVGCPCESYKRKDNPDASGQKLQGVQTAAIHRDADQRLHDTRAADFVAARVEDEVPGEPQFAGDHFDPRLGVDDVASGHEPHGDNDREVNTDPLESLDNLFETHGGSPNVRDPDDFEDEDIFQRLEWSNVLEDDPLTPNDDPDDDPGAVSEG